MTGAGVAAKRRQLLAPRASCGGGMRQAGIGSVAGFIVPGAFAIEPRAGDR
jgi:hypothetical protein